MPILLTFSGMPISGPIFVDWEGRPAVILPDNSAFAITDFPWPTSGPISGWEPVNSAEVADSGRVISKDNLLPRFPGISIPGTSRSSFENS